MPTTFTPGPVRVRVPATSANLGPGFDALGLALGRHDDVTAEVTDGGVRVSVTGEGAGELPSDERHLIVTAMRATFDALGAQPATGAAVVADGDHGGDVQFEFPGAVSQRPQRGGQAVSPAEGDHRRRRHSRPRSRCWALAAMPEWRSREASSSAMATLRCLPPVQPTATVR